MTEKEKHGGVEVGVQPDEQLPSTMVRYMTSNREKNMPCFSGQIGSPRERNWDTWLWFSLLMLFLPQLGIGESGE